MASMFVLALAIPEAYDDLDGTGLQGPVVVAVCYFVFRSLHLVMFWLVSRDDPPLRRQVAKFAPSMLGGTLLLLVASQTEGTTQTLLWAAALAADYLGTLLAGAEGWRIRSCGHFAERHGLILIVALGESIVAIGVGVALLPITVPIVVASVVGLGVAAALWWAYFDMTALSAEHAFAAEPLATRARFARDAYTFWHLPLMVGVVMTALGMKKVLEYVGDASHHDLTDALPLTAAVALCGGVAVYLLGHVGFKARTGHEVMPSRLAASLVVLALVAAGPVLPALALLVVVALMLAAMVGFERVRYADRRRELHGG